jgi:hypothetical protein
MEIKPHPGTTSFLSEGGGGRYCIIVKPWVANLVTTGDAMEKRLGSLSVAEAEKGCMVGSVEGVVVECLMIGW